MAMDRLFQLMKDKGASDMFFAVGSPVNIKLNGAMVPINQQALANENVHALIAEIANAEQMLELERDHELNMATSVPGLGRFRLSAFVQRGTYAAVFRYVPEDIPALGSLDIPSILGELIMEKRGLMLLVGATGSGKSTTIAAMLDHRNEQKSGHILTLEDPIEFQFKNKKSIVNQRELGSDAKSFNTALKNAMRQAPDCILIGEIRDRESMAAALAYAQSGHLVLATLHANNSYNALNRIISFYPIENRPALLQDLSSAVKAIVSQRLVKAKAGGGRKAAVEIMVNTRYVADLIEKGEIGQIKEAMEKSLSPGSQSFELALLKLVKDDMITQEEALANADSATNLLWLLNNQTTEAPKKPEESVKQEAAPAPSSTSFTEFTLNV